MARLDEAAEIAFMSRDMIEQGLAWRWTPRRVAGSIKAADVNVLIARGGQRLAGFAIMRYEEDNAHLDLLAVAPQCRRTGVGKALVRWLEECAVVAGIFNVTLELRAGNQGARRFYASLGYRPVAEVPGYYQGREAALRMQHDLSRRSNRGHL